MTTSTKRDNKSVVISATHIILDIEGTTSSISFVKDVLFPYVRQHLNEYLDKHWGTPEIQEIIKNLKAEAKDDQEKKVEGVVAIPETEDKQTLLQAVINNINWQMDNDRKTKCLKDLQGVIMEEGYQTGEIKGHVYNDVEPCLKLWAEDKRDIYIYSSGSVHAQKLLFGHSEKGDLLPMIKGHFDTSVGPKGELSSYKKILEEISCNANEVAFFTDVPKEARAAKEAGILAILLLREGNAPLTDDEKTEFNTITSFTEIEFEINCKKRKTCSVTDVTNDNKQVTNCSVSFEEDKNPKNPDPKTNSDVEMMEVEEDCTAGNNSEERKIELNEEVKVEDKVQESSHNLQKEENSSPIQNKLENIEVSDKTSSQPALENCGKDDKTMTEEKVDSNGQQEGGEIGIEEEKNRTGLNSGTIKQEIIEKVLNEDKISDNAIETPNEKLKKHDEEKVGDSIPESHSKVEEDVCEDNTAKEILKVNSNENICEEALEKQQNGVSESETSAMLTEELKENVQKTALTEDGVSEKVGVHTLQEKSNPENVDDCMADKNNIVDPIELSSVGMQTGNECNATVSSIEDKDIKSSSENAVTEKLSEVNNSDESKLVEQSTDSVEIESKSQIITESQENNKPVKESDKSNEDEPMEVESPSEHLTESQNVTESKNGPVVEEGKPSTEDSKSDLNPDTIDTNCKLDLKGKDSTVSEIEQSQKDSSQENDVFDDKNEDTLPESSSVKVSFKGKVEKVESEGNLDAHVKDCNTKVNGETVQLMEMQSQFDSEKQESNKKECLAVESIAEESDDVVEKHDEGVKSNKMSADNTTEFKTETETACNDSEKKSVEEKSQDIVNDVKGSEEELKKIETESTNMCSNNAECTDTLNTKEIKTEMEDTAPLMEKNSLEAESNGLVEVAAEAGEKKSVDSNTVQNELKSLNGTDVSENGKLSNGKSSESHLNGSSSPNPEQEISNDISKSDTNVKKCDTTENTNMETVVEA